MKEYDALIIKGKWLGKIFAEKDPKDWEIRGSRTEKRGKILLIESGTGMIVGQTEITGCMELDLVDFVHHEHHHKIPDSLHQYKLPYPHTFAWQIKGSKKYREPIPYNHPQGAVIWVKIPAETLRGTEAENLMREENGRV